MERGIVVLTDRGRDASLGKETRRREERPLGEHEDVSLGRSAQSREEPRDSAADDDERQLGIAACISRFAHGSFRL